MSLGINTILDGLVSHAMALGLFETVNTHEPKNKPSNGLTAALWVQYVGPLPAASGLAQTSTRLEFTLRIYTGMLQEPQDAIDPAMVEAVDTLIAAYSGDFTLSGSIMQIDLLGTYGAPLNAKAGYLHMDGKLFRIMDLTVPCIVLDNWNQVA